MRRFGCYKNWMRTPAVLLIGAMIGALDGGGIFFAPGEPFKVEIFFAAILKGIFVSLITGLSLGKRRPWLRGAGFGLLYGCGIALIVFLAKGGFRSMDAPFVVPSGIVMGALTGILVAKFGFGKSNQA
jgi:hypothetical protein